MKKNEENLLINEIIKNNSSSAKVRLAKKYVSLVFTIAGKFSVQHDISFQDIVEEGMLALFKAVENVEKKNSDVSFKDFAKKLIVEAINTFIINSTTAKIDPP